ncbi:MAG TPA: PIG-L deacetylase family protein [Aliidongia sp.]|uniref:PIG-L deacetylase family protein n=1 Tax=Aliidongia sp. TaxID=1914230 RepID=UPI002DDCF09B|nr:PIG-L deacetylase family protein [Aliidongia sp.]HEV2676092.1 PIG-L deacetylase family protein [Aliidongia sp.]
MVSAGEAMLELDGLRGTVLVVAPHPDDESIGCGGLIATLRRREVDVHVVIMTDGTGSHPNSPSHPPGRLAAVRAGEVLDALAILGVAGGAVSFWQLGDRFVPDEGADGFEGAAVRARALLRVMQPSLLVIPGRADSHGDHRAVWAIWSRAAAELPAPPRQLEYIVWPRPDAAGEGRPVTLDIGAVLALKRRAIAAHRSQLGLVIDDDPTGFHLPDDLLARADRPQESYFEARP